MPDPIATTNLGWLTSGTSIGKPLAEPRRTPMPDPIEPDPDPIQSGHNYPDRLIDLNTADLVTEIVTASDGERSIRVRRRDLPPLPEED